MADSSPAANWKRSLLLAWLTLAIGYIALIPVSKNLILYPLLLSLGAIAGIGMLQANARTNSLFLAPAGLWLSFVIYGAVVAIARNAESWPRTLVFLFVWPVFYFVIVMGFKRNLVRVVFSIGAVVTIFISVVFLLAGLIALGHLPADALPSWVTSPLGLQVTADSKGAIALTAHSLPPLMWWGAMWVASLACGKNDVYLPPVWIRFLSGSLAIAASIVAWRRGIVLIFVLVPLIMLTTWLLLSVRNQRVGNPALPKGKCLAVIVVRLVACYVVALALSVGVQSQVGYTIAHGIGPLATTLGLKPTVELAKKDIVATGIGRDNQLADKIREGERGSLTKWSSVPDAMFGHGIGASLPRGGIVRVVEPWKTELQYHALYYWTGIIGLLLLLSTLVASLRTIRRAFGIPDGLKVPLYVSGVGAVATLVGNATNPYLQAPGHMWPVFFPFMIASVIFASQPHGSFQDK